MKLWEEKQEDEVSQRCQESNKEGRLKSKLYKVFLVLVKYTPIICLITEILTSLFAYFSIEVIYFLFIGGFSMSSVLLLYVASYVFRFCYLYRLSLHSIVLTNIIALIDTLIGIPLSDLNILRMYLVILLVGVISFIKFKIKDAKHNKKFIS